MEDGGATVIAADGDQWIGTEIPFTPGTGALRAFCDTYAASGCAHALMHFDLSGLPIGSIVEGASLHIYVLQEAPSSDFSLQRFEVLEAWTEGDASWNDRQAGVPWLSPGAGPPSSRASAVVATNIPTMLGEQVIDLENGVVQRWID